MNETSRCGSILVVDDDGGSRELIVSLLRDAGYEAKAVDSAAAGLEHVARERPQLTILDVCMPDVSGYEACRRLRDLYGSEMPILFVSGERVEPVDRAAGLLLGGDDYLAKPFAPDELVARVVSLIRRAQPAETPTLTDREQEVLELLAQGMRRREIAHELVISPKTVSAHLTRIYEKLGARDRVQAVINAYRTKILDPL